jgi:hypothetical protein
MAPQIKAQLPKVVWQRLHDQKQRPFCLLMLPRTDKIGTVFRVCPYLIDSPHLNSTLATHGESVVVGYYKPSNDPAVAAQIQEDIELTRCALNAVIVGDQQI